MSDKLFIRDFKFSKSGHGHYLVTYTSPKTGKEYRAITSNMMLIDATKNADNPKGIDLVSLLKICKKNDANKKIKVIKPK